MRKFLQAKNITRDLLSLAKSQSRNFTTQKGIYFNNMYMDGSVISEYLDFHYSTEEYFNIKNFQSTCANICIRACQEHNIPLDSALDAGCSVGRSTFELARMGFCKVYGIDISERFIKLAQKLKDRGRMMYTRTKEGDLLETKEIDLLQLGLDATKDRVKFSCQNLEDYLWETEDKFNLIFAGNLICRMRNPKKFLQNVDRGLKPGGMLIIASTYSWMEKFTSKKEWIGGFLKDGKEYLTYQGLSDCLSDRFKQAKELQQVEFVIRQNQREYILSISELTFWKLAS